MGKFFYENVQIRKRRRLPHWHVPGGLYFVTFRLDDAMTRDAEEVIHEDAYLRHASSGFPPAELARRVARDIAVNVDKELDAGRGSNALLRKEAALEVIRCLEYRDRNEYLLIGSTVMSNHVHVVFKLLSAAIDEVMQEWKSITSRRINRQLGARGKFWQDDYYDVLIRDDAHLTKALAYTVNNPLKVGASGEFTRTYPENLRALDLQLVGSIWQLKT